MVMENSWREASYEEKNHIVNRAAARVMSEIFDDEIPFDEFFSAEEMRRMLIIAVSCESCHSSRGHLDAEQAIEIIEDVFSEGE